MNKVWKLLLALIVSMALQGQSLACGGAAIGSIGSSSASPPGAPSGVRGRSGLLSGITDTQIDALMTSPFRSEVSEQTELQKELGAATFEEAVTTFFASENVAPVVGIVNSFSKFNASLYNSINNPTPENEKNAGIAGVEFGLAATGAAIGYAVAISVGAVPGALVGIGLAVASHYGAVAMLGLGGPK